MTEKEAIVVDAHSRYSVQEALLRSLKQHKTYHWRPTERLAAQIGAGLIGHERHPPERLQHVLECVNELRARLMSAKV